MKKIAMIIFVLFSIVLFIEPALASKELNGMVVVIDAGHGGLDPGANKPFPSDKKKLVTESAYCFDVAMRLERILKGKGASVIRTTENRLWKTPVANHPSEALPSNREAISSLNKLQVRAGKSGLRPRVEIANRALKVSNLPRVCFISIHFDALRDKELQSARIIAGKNANDLSVLLERNFEEERRISNSGKPVLKNGDKSHGIRNIYVLSDANQVKQKVLVELGNFNNEKDLWRIRDYKVRENYAQIITRALMELNAQPIKR